MHQETAAHHRRPAMTERFTSAFRHHAAGVAVVTFRAPGPPHPDLTTQATPTLWGFTATSVASVSADPPVLCFSLDSASSCAGPLARTSSVAVSLLGVDQAGIAAQFAARGADRFAGGGWWALPTGEAVVTGARAWLRATVTERLTAGSSTLVVALVTATERAATSSGPLVYHDRRFHRLAPAPELPTA